jgi:hypothetical protein
VGRAVQLAPAGKPSTVASPLPVIVRAKGEPATAAAPAVHWIEKAKPMDRASSGATLAMRTAPVSRRWVYVTVAVWPPGTAAKAWSLWPAKSAGVVGRAVHVAPVGRPSTRASPLPTMVRAKGEPATAAPAAVHSTEKAKAVDWASAGATFAMRTAPTVGTEGVTSTCALQAPAEPSE